MSACYNYAGHNPQALFTKDLFINFNYKFRKTIYRLPYKKRFTPEETRDYIFEEFIRQVLLDIINNNTIFAYRSSSYEVLIQKKEFSEEAFKKLYNKGRFKLDCLRSNFTGHYIGVDIERVKSGKIG